ncbi:PTS system mannose/fructose/N-acetylgalactosamine-transporter subunit IIB [Allonocardiopsis opalescens]|uniref:PTS system N-acetylgalactosamine-specific IIB component/PTS system mannose-specific IIB component n=1 Tax=Allonocardiopsis opalescens TaxID=1144618 RepID=A0A2T0Q2W0_9ACTN|nr:PTS sugar transporter subunit IIB [Allonocardiopsis opalescens]PRX98132.1 PTS system N-acetylgalactosamine-specific IIB component/PTS system mannose-specific IIB component [Allonocardiopsis opalescens]
MELVLVRVDHRLVHGQVTMGWTRSVAADVIIVANDRVAGDAFEKSLVTMAVPHGVGIEIWTVAEAARRLGSGAELPEGRALLLVSNPVDLLTLVDGGLKLTEVNIGGVRSPGAKIKLTKEVHATDAEIQAWKRLAEHGLELSVQWLPGQRRNSLNAEVLKR